MRIVTWMLMGIGAGALAGFASALLRRRHHRVGDSVAEYAGGYAAPVASEDQTASRSVTVGTSDSSNVSDSSPPSVAATAAHANGAGRGHRLDYEGTATAGRTDRAEHVGWGGRG